MKGRKPLPKAYPAQVETLGDHLGGKRLDLGLLQRKVAQELRVTEASVCNWENGRSSPALRFVPRIIEFLDYDPYDTQPEDLGERIIAVRRKLGLSQKELARGLGVDPTTVGRWERGQGRS